MDRIAANRSVVTNNLPHPRRILLSVSFAEMWGVLKGLTLPGKSRLSKGLWACQIGVDRLSAVVKKAMNDLDALETEEFKEAPLKKRRRRLQTYLAFFALLIQRLLALMVVFCSQSGFQPRRRPPCTTMPWDIKSALLVLWGVCWMFYNPIAKSALEDQAFDLFAGASEYSVNPASGKSCCHSRGHLARD